MLKFDLVKILESKMSIKSFNFNGIQVYNAGDLRDIIPDYFRGSILKIIEKRNIPDDAYFYANYTKKEGWKSVPPTFIKKKLLLKASWVEDHKLVGFEPLPSSIYNEFCHKASIDVRGEKEYDKIWFKAADVEEEIEESVEDLLDDENDSKRFLLKDNTVELYLSYQGLVKVSYRCKKEFTINFQKMFAQNYFAFQFKTDVKDFLNTNLNTNKNVHVAYVFINGYVKDHRGWFNIPNEYNDQDIIIYYGVTMQKDFAEKYSKLSSLTLKYHVYTDENTIDKYFKDWHFKTHVAIMSENTLNNDVYNIFENLGNSEKKYKFYEELLAKKNQIIGEYASLCSK